ncbi:cerberus precursor [Mus musculus]|uniref:Cerberus n=2 Tax=Mus musculus TaxID=10090 RepID=CER1_MOUSE|nr:cerberus precursor [Mus musculus]O55233.1 RecName: Full=Cerberus; AltName: Full=Cerberus-like protein; Short=Cer-l; AltName: Full=Cerberus-related protein; Flags: Precursor [Mus musculus]AAC02430.1 cerberus homolog [Mus musculus]AAC24461.1 cerberus-related 1 [Mus musculus]AAI32432.1 Cerberus 1 homolog (Xenopus laevis) [Mus musculus]AAI45994.1 Cerberus 1 homolog (Xenopus laevis) [Mus musculus]|eukprot:NP_034017.1 cerberus precursor [Mus musculus]
MHLLLVQLLVLLPLGKADLCVDGCQSQGSLSFPLLERGRRDLHVANHEEAEDKPDLFVAVPHLMGTSLAGEGQRQRGKMLSRLGRFWKKPETEFYPPRDVESDHVSSGMQAVTQPADGRKVERSPLQEEAKRFWHRFMFRKGPAFQGVILPIKSHEVHWETCRTVPFNQTIAHEDCQKVVVQNNLCFGKCSSIRFPGEGADAHSFCSHCSPTKFTTVHLMLNCTSPTPVVKMVMQVEECQCMVKTERGEERLLLAGSQGSFIPGLPASKTNP